MKIKPRTEILSDIIRDAKKHPTGWHASFGTDANVHSHDYFIFHPDIGIYLMKEYNKNPFVTKGIGSKLARRIDDDIIDNISKKSAGFGIIQGDIQKILYNINRGIPPQEILASAIQGKDLGIKIPVKGHASRAKDTFHSLKNSYPTQQKKLRSSFEKLASDEGMYTSYG